MTIKYKHFRSSSYTIFPYVTWSRFMMVAVLNCDWHLSFTVWILQNIGFWKLCPFSSTEFVTQCCSSASAGCASLTVDFYKHYSKTLSRKNCNFSYSCGCDTVYQSVCGILIILWVLRVLWRILHLVGGGAFCDSSAGCVLNNSRTL